MTCVVTAVDVSVAGTICVSGSACCSSTTESSVVAASSSSSPSSSSSSSSFSPKISARIVFHCCSFSSYSGSGRNVSNSTSFVNVSSSRDISSKVIWSSNSTKSNSGAIAGSEVLNLDFRSSNSCSNLCSTRLSNCPSCSKVRNRSTTARILAGLVSNNRWPVNVNKRIATSTESSVMVTSSNRIVMICNIKISWITFWWNKCPKNKTTAMSDCFSLRWYDFRSKSIDRFTTNSPISGNFVLIAAIIAA